MRLYTTPKRPVFRSRRMEQEWIGLEGVKMALAGIGQSSKVGPWSSVLLGGRQLHFGLRHSRPGSARNELLEVQRGFLENRPEAAGGGGCNAEPTANVSRLCRVASKRSVWEQCHEIGCSEPTAWRLSGSVRITSCVDSRLHLLFDASLGRDALARSRTTTPRVVSHLKWIVVDLSSSVLADHTKTSSRLERKYAPCVDRVWNTVLEIRVL